MIFFFSIQKSYEIWCCCRIWQHEHLLKIINSLNTHFTNAKLRSNLQANMHAAFSYDRRDPYARLPLEHVSSANDPSTTSITSVNNISDHVSNHFIIFSHRITVWKISNYPATLILHEINFDWFQKVKRCHFDHFRRSKFLTFCEISKNRKIKASRNIKWQENF